MNDGLKRYAVKFRADVDAQAIATLEARVGVEAIRRIAPLRVAVYALSEEAALALTREPSVEYVEEERTMTIR